jgi:hypothetical protein
MQKAVIRHIAKIALGIATCYVTFVGSQSCPVVLNSFGVTKIGSGTGVVTSSPTGINCGTTCSAVFATDATITLTAKADAGSVFAGWTGICNGAGGSISVGPLPVNASCTATFTSTNPTAGPSGAHPRLWLSDPATLNRLTAAARANSGEWQRLKTFCDTKTGPDFDYQGQEPFRYIPAFALCYRIVKANSGDAAAAPYANKAINVLQSTSFPVLSFTAYSTDSGYGIRNYVPAMAIAYDWLYDYSGMTASLKSQIASRINNWMTWYAASGYANGTDYVSNYNAGYMRARVMAAIALYNEDAQSANLWRDALAHFNGARQKLDQVMPGGHWPEGWNYGAAVYQNYLWAASALSLSTNDTGYLNFNWLSNNVIFKASAVTPDGKFSYDDGAWTGDGYGAPSLTDAISAGYAFGWSSTNGKIARTYIDIAAYGGARFEGSVDEWKPFFFYDPASQGLIPASYPKSYHAKGSGLVTMRSDWLTTTGTWASFIAGPYRSYQGSQDKDQGHLELYKSAPLLVDVSHGYYGPSYTKNTMFQNTFTLENRSDSSYSGQDSYTDSCPNPSGSNPIGVNAYIDNGTYTFTSGEFSAAYQLPPVDSTTSLCGPNAVTWLNRSTFYLRPDLFVVYDQIQKSSNQTGMVPTMHLHFPKAPVAQGSGNKQFAFDNGTARLQMVTVLPANNNSVVTTETGNQNAGPAIPNWHLTVKYTDPSAMYQKFLTVLRTGQSTAAYTFPTVTAVSSSNASGSLITGLAASGITTPIVVVFAEGGSPRVVPASIQYSYPSSGATQNYVAKLNPNAFYTVTSSPSGGTMSITITESASGTRTDGAGVLSFSF